MIDDPRQPFPLLPHVRYRVVERDADLVVVPCEPKRKGGGRPRILADDEVVAEGEALYRQTPCLREVVLKISPRAKGASPESTARRIRRKLKVHLGI
jgi:hypothetical protein